MDGASHVCIHGMNHHCSKINGKINLLEWGSTVGSMLTRQLFPTDPTGRTTGGRHMREGSRTGPCSCTLRGEQWFNVRLEIRGNAVIVFMDNIPAASFKSHFPASSRGSGVLVTGRCRASIRFRNFNLSPLPSLFFDTKNCQSARLSDNGDYYKLMAYGSLRDSPQPGICRALFPEVIAGNSYVIRVKFYSGGSLLGGKYGIIFNVKNSNSFEFVYFR